MVVVIVTKADHTDGGLFVNPGSQVRGSEVNISSVG